MGHEQQGRGLGEPPVPQQGMVQAHGALEPVGPKATAIAMRATVEVSSPVTWATDSQASTQSRRSAPPVPRGGPRSPP